MPDLKPCPFCGESKVLEVTVLTASLDEVEWYGKDCAVECNSCGARGPLFWSPYFNGIDGIKKEAQTAWNTRHEQS
jgi:Lar family restriction alleviation protein